MTCLKILTSKSVSRKFVIMEFFNNGTSCYGMTFLQTEFQHRLYCLMPRQNPYKSNALQPQSYGIQW